MCYVNLYTFNPLFMRGARATGLPAFYQTKMLGGTGGQAEEAAWAQILNTWSHPLVGPIPRAALAGAIGAEAHLIRFRDRSGSFGPELLPAIPRKTPPG